MEGPLRKPSTPAIIAAIEANFAEEMAAIGRHLPGAVLHEDEAVHWFYTGMPTSMFNGVLHTHITSDAIDAKIDEVVTYFKERNVPLTWPVGPTTLPTNMASYLKTYGFTHTHDSTGMAVALEALPSELPTPPNFRITAVNDLETLKAYSTTSMRGFGSTEESNRVYYETYSNIGFGQDVPWCHFVGWLNDEPAAVSSLLLHAGVAGVYGVTTLAEARRKGIGAAMTLAPLREAHRRGYHVGVLSPSEMGMGVYEMLGFRTYCTMSFYRLAF